MSWKVDVIADDSGDWVANGMRFPTYHQAVVYSIDLARRWSAVRQTRIVESTEPPNQDILP